ncbi:hypothetical protein KYG33_18630 [Chryseobacterium sp. D764]|uniref:reverse transcriptase domain-containing protein n=1 Tax=Chryseobacterium sp. D764 TaxID=2856522 RepID=UPI001C587A6A|nr:reverse transcriptase domain-containing protein [Chryseobacterium sp. D764]QXU48776.1 hypothetical protein KYG33_18630 [Chryseobacterium sp. D764]
MPFEVSQIKEAYTKLRTYIYYDSGDLLLREQLVEFETDLTQDPNDFFKMFFNNDYMNYRSSENKGKKISIEEKLEIITDRLNKFNDEPEFFNKFIKEIEINFYPKKFANENQSQRIISNIRTKDRYPLEKVTAFINAPIEIHILSVLWILEEGVKLDAKLTPECIGNRLLLNIKGDRIVKGSGLFKPYFSQYQKWRDDAVSTSKNLLNQDKNVLFLNLDIKDYFYSVRKDRTFFNSKKNSRVFNAHYNLNQILLEVHINFTEKLITQYKVPYDFSNEIKNEKGEIQKFVLPIGLLSSFVIANDYLKDFDKIIIEKFKPAYYGRYVDDILLVLADPNPLNFKDENLSDYKFSFQKYKKNISAKKDSSYKIDFGEKDLTEVELYILNNFHPLINLVNSPFKDNVGSCQNYENRVFKIDKYPSLYCQSEKTLLYYFDKNESSIVIDKLKKEIEEKSSEFRDMPNDEDNLIEFEENAYHLLYDGTEGKIRTLKDYKEDRFGLSVYLSHKINMALRKQSKISESEQAKILKFFKGENCLTFYKLWEKIFTLFVVNDLPKPFIEFLFHCIEQIDKISDNNNTNIYSFDVKYSNVRETLVKYLFCAYELSVSLNLKFFNEDYESDKNYEFKSKDFEKNNYTIFFNSIHFTKPNSIIATRFRKSNMLRHHYVIIPLLNYTNLSTKGEINLVDRNTHIKSFVINEKLLIQSPRPIKFWECCIASSFQSFNNFSNNPFLLNNDGYVETNVLYDIEERRIQHVLDENEEVIEDKEIISYKNYLEVAYNLYVEGNTNHLAYYKIDEKLKKSLFEIKPINENDNFLLNEFRINSNQVLHEPKISFANTEILEKNILSSILGKPNLSTDRYNKLSKILKKSREEKTDILLFPECFIPFNLLSTISRYAVDNQTAIVSGLEHLTINNTSFNYVATILPFEINGIKDATIILRLKNNYSPAEEHTINKYHLNVPKSTPNRYEIINWKNIYFSVCYCFEMANITHREALKGKIDLLVAIEWNKDIPYFSNIVESSSRDLHCYVAQVNTSNYGDTRLTQPKETAIKDIMRLKGGINDTILVGEISIKKLRDFQRIKSSINTSKEYKPLPPNFSLQEVLKRIKNE